MSDKIKIGWASRDISTDLPITLPGQFYQRINEGVFDPVTVTALAIENGENVIFLSADMAAVFESMLEDVKEEAVKLDPSVPAESVIMNATHTHTGPGRLPDVKERGNDEYYKFAVSQMAKAVCEAWNNRAEGGIAYGYGYAVVAHSRRALYLDDTSKRGNAVKNGFMVNGHAIMYGNTADDMFAGYESGADHFINIMYTYDADGRLTGAAVNVPCPSQNSEHMRKLSADYWHDARTAIRKKHGDIYILPQCGAAGDLSPRILHYKQAQERRFKLKYGSIETELGARRDIGERIAAAFDEVLEWASKEIFTELPVVHRIENIKLDKRKFQPDEVDFALTEMSRLEKEGNTGGADYRRLKTLAERNESIKTDPQAVTQIHVVSIGNIAFVTNRFELFMDFMHRIQARSPFEQTFVIQLAGVPKGRNGSYLATKKGALNKGYGACMFDNLISPEGGQQLVEETLKALKEIHK